MGIFTRIGDILRSNINDLLDKAEDPEKMVKQIILDMQKELAKATTALGKAMAAERIAKKQYEDAQEKSLNWENKAKAALQKGDQELAKKALANKVKADKDTVALSEMYETISTQTETIRDQVELLKSKLEEAKARQSILIARSQMAETQKDLAKTVGGLDAGSSFDKLSKMEEKIVRKEAEAQAFTDLADITNTTEQDEFANIETDVAVDNEMARLMAEMGMSDKKSE
jgi:phage shock protein A